MNGPELGGSFPLGRWRVHRAGYGAMQLAGDGVFGPPRDRGEALRVLRAAVAAGVDHIDTAQFYGAGTVNELIREALYPYPDELAIVTKVGARRAAGGAPLRAEEARELRAGIEDNLRTLGAGRLAAVNLRMMDPGETPGGRFDAQLAVLVRAREEGLIDGVGLSNTSREQLLRAVGQTPIVCVQNLFNLADQRSRDVLVECEARGIAFVPFCPLGLPGELRRLGGLPRSLAGLAILATGRRHARPVRTEHGGANDPGRNWPAGGKDRRVIAMSDEQGGKTSDPRGEALLEELTRNLLKPTDLPEGYQLEGPAEPGADADVPGVLGGSGITIISEDEDEPGNRLSEHPPDGV